MVTLVNGWIKEAIEIDYGQNTFGAFPHPPKWIVLHGTAWPGASAQHIATDWQNAPVTENSVSSHLIINKDGSFVQGLSMLNTAWGNSGAAGSPRAPYLPSSNLNYVTISIEHCKNDANQNSDPLTPAQQATSFACVEAICNAYGIPKKVVLLDDVSQGGIIRHKDCDNANRPFCPGTYDYAGLKAYLNKTPPPAPPAASFNTLVVDVWESQTAYFKAVGQPLPVRDTGIFNSWRDEWIAKRYRGVPLTHEFSTVSSDGKQAVAQSFSGGLCLWTGAANWE